MKQKSKSKNLPKLAPLVVGTRHAMQLLGHIGRDKLWELIKTGAVASYMDGSRRKITVASIDRHIERKLAEQSEGAR